MTRLYAVYALMLLLIYGCSGDSKEKLFGKGVAEIKNGNANGAIVYLKGALEADENYLDARQQLAIAYIDAGKIEPAERELQKVLQKNPAKIELKLLLAKVYNLLKKPDDALKVIDEYLAVKSYDSDALEYKGIAYAIKRMPSEAERFFTQALQVDPKRESTRIELAVLYTSLGRHADARKQMEAILLNNPSNIKACNLLAQEEKARGSKEKAIEQYRKVASLNKEDASPLYAIGIINIEQNDLVNAEKVATELTQQFPKRSETARLKGIISFKKNNLSDAEANLQSSIKLQPSLEGYYYLGLTQHAMGLFESAISQFNAILGRSPAHEPSQLMIAMIMLQQKRVDDAIEKVTAALKSNPDSAQAHNLLGSAYIAKGKFDDGMRELKIASQLDPSIADTNVKKGILNLSRGDSLAAGGDFQAALRAQPENLNLRLLLQAYNLRQKDPGKAKSVLKQGLTGKKEDAIIYNALASVAFSQRQIEEAVQYLQTAKKSDPSFWSSYYYLASYFASQGESDKAIAEFQEVLAKDPQNVKALLSVAALQDLRGRDKEALEAYTRAKQTKSDAAYLEVAEYYLRKKDSANALKVLNEAVSANSKNMAALETKGKLLAADKKYKEALDVFDEIEQINKEAGLVLKLNTYMVMNDAPKALEQAQKIVSANPKSATGYMVVASLYEKQNNLDRAIDELKKGLVIEPGNYQARLQLGEINVRKKDYKTATATFSECIKVKPDLAPAYFALGAVQELSGNKKDAVNRYREALARDNNLVLALNNLAYLYADGYGSKSEALRLANAAYMLQPGNVGILDTLGFALLKNGKAADAVKIYEKITATMPDNGTFIYHYSLALKANGERVKALEKIQVALRSRDFPESALARQLSDELSLSNGSNKIK